MFIKSDSIEFENKRESIFISVCEKVSPILLQFSYPKTRGKIYARLDWLMHCRGELPRHPTTRFQSRSHMAVITFCEYCSTRIFDVHMIDICIYIYIYWRRYIYTVQKNTYFRLFPNIKEYDFTIDCEPNGIAFGWFIFPSVWKESGDGLFMKRRRNLITY